METQCPSLCKEQGLSFLGHEPWKVRRLESLEFDTAIPNSIVERLDSLGRLTLLKLQRRRPRQTPSVQGVVVQSIGQATRPRDKPMSG